jgi:zinc transporter 1/2/3
MALTSMSGVPADFDGLGDVPTALLQAELLRRDDAERPACGTGVRGKYNTSLHVGALFLILFVSIAGK